MAPTYAVKPTIMKIGNTTSYVLYYFMYWDDSNNDNRVWYLWMINNEGMGLWKNSEYEWNLITEFASTE